MSIPAGFLLLAMFLPHVGCLRLSVPAGWINYMGRMMRVLFLAHSDDSVAESRLLPELRDVELFDMDKENLFGANEDGTAAAFSKFAFWPPVRCLRGIRLWECSHHPIASTSWSERCKADFTGAIDEILLTHCNPDPDCLGYLLGRITGLKTLCLEYDDDHAHQASEPRQWSPNELCEVIERCAGSTLVNLSLTFSVFRHDDELTVPIRNLRGFRQLRWLEVQAFMFFEEVNFFGKGKEYIERYGVEWKEEGTRRHSEEVKAVDADSIQRLRDLLPASLRTLRLGIHFWDEEACVMFEDLEVSIEERLPCLAMVEVACHRKVIPIPILERLENAKIASTFIGRDMIPWHVSHSRAT